MLNEHVALQQEQLFFLSSFTPTTPPIAGWRHSARHRLQIRCGSYLGFVRSLSDLYAKITSSHLISDMDAHFDMAGVCDRWNGAEWPLLNKPVPDPASAPQTGVSTRSELPAREFAASLAKRPSVLVPTRNSVNSHRSTHNQFNTNAGRWSNNHHYDSHLALTRIPTLANMPGQLLVPREGDDDD
jgi:hypothetical protein